MARVASFPHLPPKWGYPGSVLLIPKGRENDRHNEIGRNVRQNSKRQEPDNKALAYSTQGVEKLDHCVTQGTPWRHPWSLLYHRPSHARTRKWRAALLRRRRSQPCP